MTDTITQHDVVDLLIEQHTQIRDLFGKAESATANTLAGPVLSLFDRTKDLARKAISDTP